MKKLLLLLLFPVTCFSQEFTKAEIERFHKQASAVTIIEDTWGVPHIYGRTDADAVFGMMYVQCLQNFRQVERNYLEVFGRLAEADGDHMIWQDIQMQMIYDTAAAKRDYAASPAWLKKLLHAFADGVNFYLYKHPSVKPVVLKRFEPWFPLMYTDGSISATQTGGIRLADTRRMYGPEQATGMLPEHLSEQAVVRETGSNGFALAPSRTASGNAMLYINPHVTFYFRLEAHMVSEEGLNVYGAATWGNFFIYQGFNEMCGWMHTSSYADVADVYEERVEQGTNAPMYRYNDTLRPFTTRELSIPYRSGDGIKNYTVTVYYSHHGPVLGSRSGKWLSLRERNRSATALQQSWLRTKASGLAAFRKTMALRSNNSNNTVFADNKGNIAYWHGNFVPVRDPRIDWSLPVDGSTSKTEWKGVHRLEETVHIVNPSSGWIQNCNSTPFTASGSSSPLRKNYPAYMAPDGQNGRALNAIRLLSKVRRAAIDDLVAIGYDRHLAGFDIMLPSMVTAWEQLQDADTMKARLAKPVQYLRLWDHAASAPSVATTLAVEWAAKCQAKYPSPPTTEAATNQVALFEWVAQKLSAADKLGFLSEVIGELQQRYGTWEVAWGDINRYQRNEKSSNTQFDDHQPSIPCGLAAGTWGSLPSYNSRRFPNTSLRYGISGNSFIAAVEFGKKLRARTIVTGGASTDPASVHFTDQAEGFLEGKFKEVFFYRDDVLRHKVKEYHPGGETGDHPGW